MSRKCSKVAKSLIRLGKMVVEEVGWTWMTFHNFIKLYTTATTTMKKKPPDNGQMSGWKMVGKLGGKCGRFGVTFSCFGTFPFPFSLRRLHLSIMNIFSNWNVVCPCQGELFLYFYFHWPQCTYSGQMGDGDTYPPTSFESLSLYDCLGEAA